MNELTGLVLPAGISKSDTDIYYLSGFTAPDPFLFMKTVGKNYLVVSTMEKGRAEKQAKPGIKVFTPEELGLKGKKGGSQVEQICALMEKTTVRRIMVPETFPVGIFKALQKKGIIVSINRKSICPERMVKTKEEIVKIRRSQQAGIAAMHAATTRIGSARIDRNSRLRFGKESLTSENVRQLIQKTLIDHNCTGVDTIVAGGEQGTDPHVRGQGPLYAGQSIIIDIFPQSEKTGYWGDLTRTVCRGKASPELKKLYNAVKAAQGAALRTVKPGICADEVHAAAKDAFARRGYETGEINGKHVGFIHGTGHGVGLDIHELPRIGISGETLEVGNVCTIEPGLYYPGVGGVRIEDTVVVTEKGWRYLATCPKIFELL